MCGNDVKWQFAGFSVDIRNSPVYLLDVVVFLESDVLAQNEQKRPRRRTFGARCPTPIWRLEEDWRKFGAIWGIDRSKGRARDWGNAPEPNMKI